jgi:hypothetical protein
MPLTNIIILGAIISAFVTFGIALAWAEHCTRHLIPAPRPEDQGRPQLKNTAGVHASAERSRQPEMV